MDDLADFADAFFVHAVGGGVGNHQRAEGVFVLLGFGSEIGDIDVAVFVGIDNDDFHAQHLRGGRVGAVGRTRNQADVALGLAVGFVVAADGQDAGVLALGAGVGLDGDGVKSGNGFELRFQAMNHFQIACGLLARGKGVDFGELGPGNRQHFAGGVELHGAGAERNHTAVHRQIAVFEFFQIAQHFVFGVVAVEHGVLQDGVLAPLWPVKSFTSSANSSAFACSWKATESTLSPARRRL